MDINHVYAGVLAAEHLHRRGCRRVAFIGGRDYDLSSTGRLEGVRRALDDMGCARARTASGWATPPLPTARA